MKYSFFNFFFYFKINFIIINFKNFNNNTNLKALFLFGKIH